MKRIFLIKIKKNSKKLEVSVHFHQPVEKKKNLIQKKFNGFERKDLFVQLVHLHQPDHIVTVREKDKAIGEVAIVDTDRFARRLVHAEVRHAEELASVPPLAVVDVVTCFYEKKCTRFYFMIYQG